MRPVLLAVMMILGLWFAAASPEAAARSAELVAPQDVALADRTGAPASAEQVRAAILAGAASIGYPWIVQSEQPGRIELRTVVRGKHVVVMAAVYAAGRVRFDYVSSENMNHDVRRDGRVVIHPNYMAWRAQLEQAVRTAAARG